MNLMCTAAVQWLRALAVGLIAGLGLLACESTVIELSEVPNPPTDGLASVDIEHLHKERATLRLALDTQSNELAVARAYARLGQVYIAYDFAGAAMPALRNAIALQPTDGASHYRLGVLLLRNGQFAEAITVLDSALALRPGDCAVALRLAEGHAGVQQTESARRHWLEAQSESRCEAAASAALARQALGLGDAQQAIEQAERALRLQPRATAMYTVLANAWRQLGEMQRAREAAEQAISPTATGGPANSAQMAAPGDVSFDDPLITDLSRFTAGGLGLLRQAESLRAAGHLASALELLDEALARQPDLWQAYLIRGQIHADQANLEMALDNLTIAAEAAPQESGVLLDLSVVQARTGRTHQAIATLGRLLEQQPELADARIRRAELLTVSGESGAAINDLQAVLAASPGHTDARLRLVTSHWAAGDSETALAVIDEGLEANQQSDHQRALLRQRVMITARAGQLGAAEQSAQALLEQRDPEGPALLGVVQMAIDPQLRIAGEQQGQNPMQAIEASMIASRHAITLGQYDLAINLLAHWDANDPQLASLSERLQHAQWQAQLANNPTPDALRHLISALTEQFNQKPTPEGAELAAIAMAYAGQLDQALDWQRRLIELATDNQAAPAVLTRLQVNLATMEAGGRPTLEPEFGLFE